MAPNLSSFFGPKPSSFCAKRLLRPCSHSKTDCKICLSCCCCLFVVKKVITFCEGDIGGGHVLSSLGLLTHRFFRIRKKHARCLFGNCIGRFTIDFESTFCTFFDPSKSTFWRAWRQIDKKVLEMHFLETVVRASTTNSVSICSSGSVCKPINFGDQKQLCHCWALRRTVCLV